MLRDGRRVGTAANVAGATVVFLTLAFVGGATQGDIPRNIYVELIVLFAVTMVVLSLIAITFLTHTSRPLTDALRGGRRLDDEARTALLRGPWMSALTSLTLWAVGAVIFSVYGVIRMDLQTVDALQVGLNILLGGLTTMAVVYLLSERVVRPAFAIAFREEPPRDVRGIAVGRRLLLGWVLGAGVPLVAIASIVGDSENASVDFASVQRVALTLIALALLVGAFTTRRVARTVAEPVGIVRRAMERVSAGDLRSGVDVDDATELGLLQAGFNQMVAGLRERERLSDLFGRHVGVEVARQAVERGVELGGETREASAVFVDIVGSTALTASRSPAEIVDMLNDFFNAVARAVEAEGGLVNKFEGDAALCVFGDPVESADHAASALRAARALRLQLVELRRKHPELDAGIGASTGAVVAGNVGAERRYEYTVIGDPVNEAARLTEQAKQSEGRVLVSETAVRAAGEGAGSWREVGVLELRGRPTPTRVFEPA